MHWRRILFAVVGGVGFAVLPYFLGPIDRLEGLANALAAPGVVLANLILHESIHGTIWVVPLSIGLNTLIGGVALYILAWVAKFVRQRL
jgi:hypothetical protein